MSQSKVQSIIDVIALVCSNIAPMGLAFALRTFGIDWLWFTISISTFILGGLSTLYFFMRFFIKSDTSRPIISKVESLGGEVSGYLASFMLPLALLQQPSAQELLVAGFCLAVYVVILVRTNMILINPLIYLSGYKLWKVYSENIPGGSGILIGRKEPIEGVELVVCGQNRVLLEKRG